MNHLNADSNFLTEYQVCPICGRSVSGSKRYPRYVCSNCVKRAADIKGQKVVFSNIDFGGGVQGHYVESDKPYSDHVCMIDGVKCFAQEARFGGIVILPEIDRQLHPLLKQIDYCELNARQKENYNYQKLSSVLADFGFITHRLSDDWNGADMIAQHIECDLFLKIQLKGRLTFSKKYQEKDIWVAFRRENIWYLYPHDPLLKIALDTTNISNTDSWINRGGYSFPGIPNSLTTEISRYIIGNLFHSKQ